ncbi:MAG: BrnT family toxin [Thiomargarita sp.]|nr:BrnT family toxin [Thiomargarita sp.]
MEDSNCILNGMKQKQLLIKKKHGVSFIEASEVFNDDFSSCVHDPDHSYEEERYLLFGISLKGSYLVVSFAERADVIRIHFSTTHD